jgi:hypothetical protein
MASSVIGALRVNLGLDSAQFSSGAKKAQSSLGNLQKQFLAFTAVAAAAGAAVVGLATKGATEIDRLAKSARRLDTSIGSFRALEMAATEAGVPMSTVTDNLQNINRELAKGGKATTDSLTQLGLSAADLAGMSADEKIATIADRIKDLGLSSGAATAVLQGLGVRSREMLLLFQGGGDVIRNAAADVQDYGLALDSVESDKIEAANDAIGRLSLIGTYLAQQLSLAITPAMGAFATAMTDSLREGGTLRMVIDTLVASLGVVTRAVVSLATFMGARYVAAFVAARLATMSLSGALAFLRGAIIRTGLGALIVLGGEMVYQFGKLVTATGGFGNAMEAVGVLAKAVLADIGNYMSALYGIAASVANGFASSFLNAFANTLDGAYDFVDKFIVGPINALEDALGLDRTYNVARGTSDSIRALASSYDAAALSAANGARVMYEGATRTAGALEEFKGKMKSAEDATDETAGATDDLTGSLDDLAGGGGAGGGKGAAGATASLNALQTAMKSTRDEIAKLKTETASLNASGTSGLTGDDAIDYAKKQADLLTAAQQSGVAITPQLRAEIDALSAAYVAAGNSAETAADRITTLQDQAAAGKQTLADMFTAIGTGAMKPMDALRDLLKQMIAVSLQKSAMGFMSNSSGGWLGALGNAITMPGNANGTPSFAGGLTAVNERGGEIMNLPRGTQIIPHDISKRMADKREAQSVTQTINVVGATGNAEIQRMVAAGVQQGNAQMRSEVPGIVSRHTKVAG